MSNYSKNIKILYGQRSTLQQEQDQYNKLMEELAAREDKTIREAAEKLNEQINNTRAAINQSIINLYADPLDDPLVQIEESEPVLLLPLRMETRFAKAGTELWIRVYPDAIAINNHDKAITESEKKAGLYFWNFLWKQSSAQDFADQKKKAWTQIVNHFGTNRARWIILKTKPLKLGTGEDFIVIINGQDLDPGAVEIKTQAWSEAARSYVMPDLLKLRLHIGGKMVLEVTGNPITQPLQAGPDPKAASTATTEFSWKGTGLAWLEDFDESVVAGMGFRIDLTTISSYNAGDGFSLITVMGIRSLYDRSPVVVPPPVSGTSALADLFQSHIYTPRGLSLVSQGTPTNNSDEKNSGYSERPEFSEDKWLQEQRQWSAATGAEEIEDGRILALSLGLDADFFLRTTHADQADHADAVAMNKALFPATLGFYLRHLLHPLFTADDLENMRSFFCSYVTGRGPISVLAVGPQPYGILPTTNFKKFQWIAADKNNTLFQHLISLLSKFDATVQSHTGSTAKLGQAAEPHILLDAILRLYPNSEIFFQRVGYSADFLRNCLNQTVAAVPNPLVEQLINSVFNYTGTVTEGILQIEKIIYERTALPLDRNKLVDIIPASEQKPISVPEHIPPSLSGGENYVNWLARIYGRFSSVGLERNYFTSNDPPINPPLLFLLLKHSMLLQMYKCVFHWLSAAGYLSPNLQLFNDGVTTAPEFIGSKEFLNVFKDREDISPMELMLLDDRHLPNLAPGETIAEHLLKNADDLLNDIIRRDRILRRKTKPEILNDYKNLKEYNASLEYLGSLSSAKIERCFVEHLDCLSYRLDAWQTGLVFKKLALNKDAKLASGTVIGAYGWIENLKPAANKVMMKESDLPPELQPGTGADIIQANAEGGYIHSPSLTQAKAAALLRNAYLHHHDPNDPGMMAVNLNSTRVQKALVLFEGMQKGHPIGELLGYRLERHLHDQPIPLDKYIPALRGTFALGGTTVTNPGDDHDLPTATQKNKPAGWVAKLDGLAIVNMIKSGKNQYPFGIKGLPATGDEATIIREGIDDLFDCFDAMKDLIVAESIYQLVQGNTDRAGALLKTINELKPPAKFEFIDTPRKPLEVLTHRACILFNPGDFTNPSNPWKGTTISPRAMTEPGLNEWLGEIIGPPELIQCFVMETGSRTSAMVSVQDLNLQPIDLVYLVPNQFEKDESALSKRIGYYYRNLQQLKEQDEISIHYEKADKNNLTFSELLPLLNLLKDTITSAKALNAADFDLAQYPVKTNFRNLKMESSSRGNIDIGMLVKRKDKLMQLVDGLIKKLKRIIDNPTRKICGEIRDCLIECAAFEITSVFPVSAVGESKDMQDELLAQAQQVIMEMQKITNSPGKAGVEEGQLLQSFNLFFGPAFKVMPVFHFSKIENDEIERADVVQGSYKNEEELFRYISNKTNISYKKLLQHWMNQVVYIKSKMARFETTRLMYNSFQEKQLEVHVMQLPYDAGDSWLGLEFPAGQEALKGKLSMLVHHYPQNKEPDWATSDFCGLVLDEWTEEIPGEEELTGVTFQYNQPDSQPPQALLLAISAVEGGKWDWEKLNDILLDTLDRAKKRAVSGVELSKTDWIGTLPGVVSEFSDTGANISAFYRT
ncbi:MAG: hypothetical protein ABI688_00135 [Bacteroidota bacterium]